MHLIALKGSQGNECLVDFERVKYALQEEEYTLLVWEDDTRVMIRTTVQEIMRRLDNSALEAYAIAALQQGSSKAEVLKDFLIEGGFISLLEALDSDNDSNTQN